MIRSEIEKAIFKAVKKSFGGIEVPEFSIEIPANSVHGDYSSNIAFVLAKKLKRSPVDVAGEFVRFLAKDLSLFFENVRPMPPGFINFWMTRDALEREFLEILKKKEKYGQAKPKKEKVLVEFLSANPTGPIHIGNGRGAFFGDALVKVLRRAGYKAKSEFYINNAKASEQIKNLGKTGQGKYDAYPYVYDMYLKDNPILVKKIKKMSPANAGYELAKYIQSQNRKVIEKTLRVKYDNFFEEEALFRSGETERVKNYLKKNDLVYEAEGALWFKAKKFGDSEDRVFVRRTGEPTYFLSDIVYHFNKFKKRKFNKVINIWGADHHGYAPRLKAALKALDFPEDRIKIIITQFVRLVRGSKEVKMSKRKGEFVTLEDLVGEVGLDAVRFFFLEKTPDTHMDFDLKLAKERSVKNPVYYIQYAHARICSIFKKARLKKSKIKIKSFKYLREKEEVVLMKKLIAFPELIKDVSDDYQIHRLTKYAHELARDFHNFYEKHRVIIKDKDISEERLKLVEAVDVVLKIILNILGISAPEKM